MKKIIIGVALFFVVWVALRFIGSDYSLIDFIKNDWKGIRGVAIVCLLFGFCLFLLNEDDKAFWRHEEFRERRRKERIKDAIDKGEDPKDIDWYESNF